MSSLKYLMMACTSKHGKHMTRPISKPNSALIPINVMIVTLPACTFHCQNIQMPTISIADQFHHVCQVVSNKESTIFIWKCRKIHDVKKLFFFVGLSLKIREIRNAWNRKLTQKCCEGMLHRFVNNQPASTWHTSVFLALKKSTIIGCFICLICGVCVCALKD